MIEIEKSIKKKCIRCKKLLPMCEYRSRARNKDGYEGVCRQCRNASDLAGKKKKYKRHKLEGKCVICSRPGINHTVFCEEHTFKSISLARLGTCTRWTEIKELLINQNYKCAYSGISISLANNASLEHRLPNSRGGTNDIGNLCWIDLKVNKAKSNMTYDEFVELVRLLSNTLLK